MSTSAHRLRAVRLAVDAVVLGSAWLAATWLVHPGALTDDSHVPIAVMVAVGTAVQLGMLAGWRMARRAWRFVSMRDVRDVTAAMLAATAALVVLRLAFTALAGGFEGLPFAGYRVTAVDTLLAIAGLLSVRLGRRVQLERREANARISRAPVEERRVILVGAGSAGVMMARELARRPDLGLVPVGFVDDDPTKQGREAEGLEVLGTIDTLPDLVAAHHVELAVITMAAATGEQIRHILDVCEQAGVETKIVPGLDELVTGNVAISRIRPVAIEDLLGRAAVDLDDDAIAWLVSGRTVLVTGAGGSIGSELCRQVLRYQPATLLLFERSEHALWQVDRDLRGVGGSGGLADQQGADIRALIGDVADRRRITEVLTKHRPQVVLHAAAHKHVPMMEDNPAEAVLNNVVGTRVVADACATDGSGVEVFVLVSTDKAVNPTSVMGATKRLAERYVTEVAHRHPHARFVSVRFGNVLGSTGSVIPIFREQIAAGGPVTVTDPEMTRYFMTIPEAAGLVLQAATLATEHGEVFLLDMGDPVRIVDLANEMIRLSGLEAGRDIEVVFTGARPGEKLFEELRYDDEDTQPTTHPKVWRNVGDQARWPEADEALGTLVDIHDPAQVRATLLRMTRPTEA